MSLLRFQVQGLLTKLSQMERDHSQERLTLKQEIATLQRQQEQELASLNSILDQKETLCQQLTSENEFLLQDLCSHKQDLETLTSQHKAL